MHVVSQYEIVFNVLSTFRLGVGGILPWCQYIIQMAPSLLLMEELILVKELTPRYY